MSSNSFGKKLVMTTFGESHGEMIGAILDGVPSGLKIDRELISYRLSLRKGGRNSFVTPRNEDDEIEIISGLKDEIATGAPLAFIIKNKNIKKRDYQDLVGKFRPGHAHYTYLKKYGLFEESGGGRASARETAMRVACGAVAEMILREVGIQSISFVSKIKDVVIDSCDDFFKTLFCEPTLITDKSLFIPDEEKNARAENILDGLIKQGDSLGGRITFCAQFLPVGLGDPVYEKISANLAKAMMSIPAVRGFELGNGEDLSEIHGSQFNDEMTLDGFSSNHSAGILGGITNGELLYGHVHFKPTSSIRKKQKTLNAEGKEVELEMKKGRHDPCVAIRGSVVVKAMLDLTLADALLINMSTRLDDLKKKYERII